LIHADGQLISQFEGAEFGMVSHTQQTYSLQSAASSLWSIRSRLGMVTRLRRRLRRGKTQTAGAAPRRRRVRRPSQLSPAGGGGFGFRTNGEGQPDRGRFARRERQCLRPGPAACIPHQGIAGAPQNDRALTGRQRERAVSRDALGGGRIAGLGELPEIAAFLAR
jgi:hypothetical protein